MQKIKRILFTILYYGLAQYLPDSYSKVCGPVCNAIRIFCVKRIFKKCGNVSVVNRKAYFGNGQNVEIGNKSGIGANCFLPNNIIIGDCVMMAPDCYILSDNHEFRDTSIPMVEQGMTEKKQTIIEDDVWLGVRVILTPGRTVKKGSVIAAGCVLTKDFPEYSIVGGNPGKLIKSRI